MATSKNTRMAHIVNLMGIAGIDGNISDEERNIIIKIAQNLGLSEEDFDACIEEWKRLDESKLETIVPDDAEDRYEFLKNMVLVMMADGEIEQNERAYIAGLAEKFGIDGKNDVDELIDIVYNEYFSDNEEETDEEDDSENEDDSDEEELDEEIISDADIDTRLFRLTEEQLDELQRLADDGNGNAQYVLGRYHLIVKPDDDFMDKAEELFNAAAENGNANAIAALAQMILFGYSEKSDIEDYDSLLDKALNEGSPMAMKMRLEDIIHGRNGKQSNPKYVVNFLEKEILNDDETGDSFPYLYEVLGDAYNKLGNKAKAAECYEQASDAGMKEAEYKKHFVKLEGLPQMNKEMYETVIDMECDDDIPGCFTVRAQLLGERYEEQKGTERKQTTKKIMEALEHDYELGFGAAASKIAEIYYLGEYGVERDLEKAWRWYHRGIMREDAESFAGLAKMVKEGNHPDNLPDNFLEWCQVNAERRGEGAPAKHFLAIIKPDGNATAYCFIKDDWDKVAGYVGAKRLSPIINDALDAIGKKLGIDEHLTAWIDIEAPRKKLPLNVAAKKFFKGVIAGDIILTLSDNIWDPMLFLSTDDLQKVVEALGGKLVQVVNDELALSREKRKYAKINSDLLDSENGFVARIEPDGSAHIVDTSHKLFALTEEDIYDPIRLDSLCKTGEKLSLKGRLTIWTDNSALRKQMIMYSKNDLNAIGTKLNAGPVADNFFVAMEDENFNIKLFDDKEQLKNTVIALGVKPENVVFD